MHKSALACIYRPRSSFPPYLPNSAREMPMAAAKAIGPARSPTVFDTPRPCSAKAEDHWLTACSAAPAQSIMSMKTQNSFFRHSSRSGSAPVSPLWMG